MPIQVIAGAIAVSVAVPILWFSVASSGGPGTLFGKKKHALGDVKDVRQLVLDKSAGERLGRPLMQRIGAAFIRVTPKGWAERLERRLVLAGASGRIQVEMVLTLKVALAAGLFLFGWIGPIGRLPMGWLATLIIASIGFFGPNAWISRRGDERQHRIQIQLPDVLDQLSMSVDAGLGFEAALARAARVGEAPLAEELTRTVQEMQLGVSRSDALRNLGSRSEVPDLKSFVLAVVQADEYGLPITKVLRVQADELRDKRRQRAEERALKIPVFLVFPLAVCIFPTIFIILLGPAMIRIYRGMSLINP
jgi:tight adherence protein C